MITHIHKITSSLGTYRTPLLLIHRCGRLLPAVLNLVLKQTPIFTDLCVSSRLFVVASFVTQVCC